MRYLIEMRILSDTWEPVMTCSRHTLEEILDFIPGILASLRRNGYLVTTENIRVQRI
jgi:hypothetical protein